MLVIHPKDKTTTMLSALYDGLEAQVVADCRSTKEMGHLMHHVPIIDLAPAYFHKQTKEQYYKVGSNNSHIRKDND